MMSLPRVLFVELPSRRPMPSATAMDVACHGALRTHVTSVEQAIAILGQADVSDIRVLVSNIADYTLFDFVRQKIPSASTILITGETIHHYSTALRDIDYKLVDHVVAQISEEWTANDLRITIQKILTNDLFGIEKYLGGDARVFTRSISSSKDRDLLNAEVQRWTESSGLGKNIGRLTFGITEELLMNAIYDAPVAGGRTHYENLERTSHRDLSEDERSELRYGFDSKILAISIVDPFGAFKREKWWQYTRKILKRYESDGLIDNKKGGAGLGIFKMLYSSHGIVCNVSPGKQTEVIVLIDTTLAVRDFSTMPRSIHFFESES